MPQYQEGSIPATVREALESHTVDELKRLLGLLTKERVSYRKGELVDLLLKHLEGEALKVLWRLLDETQKAAVAEVVHSWAGKFYPDRFRAKYAKDANWGGRVDYTVHPSLLRLFVYGMAMPTDLRERLKPFVPGPRATALKSIEAPPTVFEKEWKVFDYTTRTYSTEVEKIPMAVAEMERAAPHDLLAALRLVQTGKVSVSDKTFLPTAASVKAIKALLHGGDYYDEETGDWDEEEKPGPIKAFAWPMLLQAGRLVELAGKRLALTKAGQKALSAPPAETLKALWKGWLKNTLLDELRRVDVIKGQNGKGKQGVAAVAGRRQVIAEALTHCPVNGWVAVDELFRYMRALDFDFEVTRDIYSLYIAEAYYGYLGQGGDQWEVLQGRVILCLLFEYAATLGMLDVAYAPPARVRSDYSDLWGADDLAFLSRYDGLIYFRLTPLGAYCLGMEEKYTAAPLPIRRVLQALPNLDVVAAGDGVSGADVLVLDIFAKRVSEGVWHLDAAKLLTAMEEGHPVSELQEFLLARSGEALPGTVQKFLKDFQDRSDRLKDRGTVRLVECTDPALLLLILNDPRTKPHCLPAGDRHFVVRSGSEGPFRIALRQLGYILPVNEG